ncbi:hypothetical protein Ocin01_15750 [Orchesella cincta]|uniref:Uncharacterized protein n=1 Tax=Orchesella cincta TaxID=48709 RepID=A0A1D2MDE1_ORCCI|nr:hypothetical protein Ocin01_15750 [Orchesella cincta]
MSLSKSRQRFISLLLPIFFIACFQWNSFTLATNQTKNTRDLVSVWFDSPLTKNSRNSKNNLEVMIKLVAEQYGGISMDNVPILEELFPPENIIDSTMLIPIVAAEYNNQSSADKRIKTMVSFDLSPSSRIEQNPTFYNSFLVAKNYADEANKIFPGTVDTLLLHHDDYLRVNERSRIGHRNLPTELHSAWDSLNKSESSSANNTRYKLGVTISYSLCATRKDENSTEILSKFVEYADAVMPVIYVKSPRLTSCEEHDKQLELLHNCETQLQKLKPNVETIPIVMCQRPDSRSVAEFSRCWQLMIDWAIRNERKVIMWEAFSRYNSDYVGGAGRWRVNDNEATNVNETSFQKNSDEISPTCTVSNRWTTTMVPNLVGNLNVANLLNTTTESSITTESSVTKKNESQVLNTTNIKTEEKHKGFETDSVDPKPNSESVFHSFSQAAIVKGNEDFMNKKYNDQQDGGISTGYIAMITVIVLVCLVLAGFGGAHFYKRGGNVGTGSYSRAGGDEHYGLL